MRVTRDDVKLFLPCLSDAETIDLADAVANCDSDEGVEWLPWYKMALSRLADCAGTLRALADIPLGDEEKATVHAQRILREAAELWRQHLLFVGIGPNRDPKHMAACIQMAEKSYRWFLGSKK